MAHSGELKVPRSYYDLLDTPVSGGPGSPGGSSRDPKGAGASSNPDHHHHHHHHKHRPAQGHSAASHGASHGAPHGASHGAHGSSPPFESDWDMTGRLQHDIAHQLELEEAANTGGHGRTHDQYVSIAEESLVDACTKMYVAACAEFSVRPKAPIVEALQDMMDPRRHDDDGDSSDSSDSGDGDSGDSGDSGGDSGNAEGPGAAGNAGATAAGARTKGARALGGEVLSEDRGFALSNLHLDERDIHAITYTLRSPPKPSMFNVCHLDLEKCPLFDKGAVTLAQLLAESCTLQSLRASSCSIGDAGGVAIARALGKMPLPSPLTEFDLSGNSAGPKFAECLSDALIEVRGRVCRLGGVAVCVVCMREESGLRSTNWVRVVCCCVGGWELRGRVLPFLRFPSGIPLFYLLLVSQCIVLVVKWIVSNGPYRIIGERVIVKCAVMSLLCVC